MSRFAISDIHGCARTFGAILNKIELSREDELYLLGDFVDRGPDSKGVIDKIIQLQNLGFQIQCTRGNHEEMLLEAQDASPERERLWWANGGLETLYSFQARTAKDLPEVYLDWFRSLEACILLDDYILVHAGLNFKAIAPLEDHTSMYWIRNWYQHIDRQWLGDRVIVHGHTPATATKIQRFIEELDQLPVIDIDNGCVYPRPGLHQLCALNLDTRELIFQENIER